jgi:uncharacterized membrane protein
MTPHLGTGALCVGLVVWALADRRGSFEPYLVAGSALYLVGVVVTIAVHVG